MSACTDWSFYLHPLSEKDPRAHDLRSKLLSLHLVLSVLRSHSDLFADPSITIPSASSNGDTAFLQATKQYICLSLSRNALSSVPQVYELSIEIFFTLLQSLRAQMKVSVIALPEAVLTLSDSRKKLRYSSTKSLFQSSRCDTPVFGRSRQRWPYFSNSVKTRRC